MTSLKFLNWVFTGKMITDIDIFHNGQYMTGENSFARVIRYKLYSLTLIHRYPSICCRRRNECSSRTDCLWWCHSSAIISYCQSTTKKQWIVHWKMCFEIHCWNWHKGIKQPHPLVVILFSVPRINHFE